MSATTATATVPHRLAPGHSPAWGPAARLLTAACAGALAAALWLPARPPQPPATTATGIAPSVAAQPVLDMLREAAALGQPYAAVDLLAALLTGYDADDDAATLFEAMLLLDREWDRPEMLTSGMIQRVLQKYCPADPLLRHFWVCEAGE